jgi:transposase
VVYDYKRKKHLQTIRIVPDDLWEEIKLLLPSEKPNKTIGRPVVPFRKVLNGIVYIFSWK